MPTFESLKENRVPLAIGVGLGTVFGLSAWKFLRWSKTASACGGMVIAAVPIMVKSVVLNRKAKTKESGTGNNTSGSNTNGINNQGTHPKAPNPFVKGEQIEPLLHQCAQYGSALENAWHEIREKMDPLAAFSVRWVVPDCNDLSSLKDADPVLEFFRPRDTASSAQEKRFSLDKRTLTQLDNKEMALNCLYYEYLGITTETDSDFLKEYFIRCDFADEWQLSRTKSECKVTITDDKQRKAEITIRKDSYGDRELHVLYFREDGTQASTQSGFLEYTISAKSMRLQGTKPLKTALGVLAAI